MLVADLLGGEIAPRVVEGITRAVAEDKTREDELVGQVKMHNLLCRYFAEKRAQAGMPDGNCPTPVALTIIRQD